MTTKAYNRMIGDEPWAAQLDANTASIASLEVNPSVTQGAVLIVPSNYTPVGDEPDTVVTDANLPNTVSINNRYVLTNPFGENCEVLAEVYTANLWTYSGYTYALGDGGYGTMATMASNSSNPNLIVQTGGTTVVANSASTSGGGYGQGAGDKYSAPCRVWCYPVKQTGGAA